MVETGATLDVGDSLGSGVSGAATNTGALNVNDGGTLDLVNLTVTNTGTITLNATTSATNLVIAGNVTLNGGGHLTLSDDSQNAIVSNGVAATLINVDNTISGAGTIGDANLTLDNFGDIAAALRLPTS